MSKLFNIEGICKTPTSRYISVEIEGVEEPYLINRERFEKWVDTADKRKHGVLDIDAPWELYYEMNRFEDDVYDYIVLKQGESNFDISKSLSVILNTLEGKASY